jgi:outer membrane protein X
MKKFMMFAAMMLMSIGAFAQGKYAIGAEAGFASFQNSYSPTKFGAKFQMFFDENWRGELAGNMFTKKDDVGLWDANINVHYVFNVADKVNIYPLGGLAIVGTTGVKDGEGKSDNKVMVGFNLGAGVEYFLAESLKLNLDIKYKYAKCEETYTFMGQSTTYEYKANGPIFSLGIAYVF